MGLVVGSAEGKYGGGSGTPGDPYRIRDANHMQAIGADPCDWDKHFKLMADIDLSGFTGASFNIIGEWRNPFTGLFDGNDHTISNFSYTSINRAWIGIFGNVVGKITNLGLIDPNVDGRNKSNIGSLVGKNYGTIIDCYARGGSVIGDNSFGSLGYVGGVVGRNIGTITNCYSTASISGRIHVGGLAGSNSGTITNCFSTGSVSGTKCVGGLVGDNEYEGTITYCYSTGSVSGGDYVGGLAGYNPEGPITYCYSTGSVSGTTYVGGLVGLSANATISVSFWDIETSGQLSSSGGGSGRSTEQMKTSSTYLGWNGCGQIIWTIDEGNDYPRLLWEDSPGQPLPEHQLGDFLQGSGSEIDPYLVYNAEQLNMIGLFLCEWDKYFKLMADIDLSGFTGTSYNIIGNFGNPFTGLFDGNDHKISNFTYTSTSTYRIGLFGDVVGEIKNLGLIDPNVDAAGAVGSLACRNSGTITNCFAEGGSVSGGDSVGGLVGYNDYDSIITNCSSIGSVSGGDNVGGLCGSNQGTIINCYATGNVEGNVEKVGGLVGYSASGVITNCYATGSVLGDTQVGGLVGRNDDTITNCYSNGVVTGNSNVGGLVGGNDGKVIASLWDIETSSQTTSDGGTGKTTAEMQRMNTFLVWIECGTEPVWTIDEGYDYPRLWWENKPGQPIAMPLISFEGNGDANDPFLVYDAEQLNAIGLSPCYWANHFKLMADIDLSNYTGDEFNIIGTFNPTLTFTGVFDGNGHTISNFTYTSTGTDHIGLFRYIDDPNAEIKNLGLIDPNVGAGTGNFVGSLVGQLYDGTITNCYVKGGSVAGGYQIGGLVGLNYYGTITNCYSTGSVVGSGENVGGLVGLNYYGTISNSYSSSDVSGGSFVGGLVGYGFASNSYATGSVTGVERVGGLVGCNVGIITNCYATGGVAGIEKVGGLVGFSSGSLFNSYWNVESGSPDNGLGIPKTSDEMKMESTFLCWGICDSVWTIDEGYDYPRLWWENKPGEPIVGILPFEGDGDSNNPYLIDTPEQLNIVGLLPCIMDKHFKLVADIDLCEFDGLEGRESFNIIGIISGFAGVFDGNEHTVSNLHSMGLFWLITGGNIKNLGLINPYVNAGDGGGSLTVNRKVAVLMEIAGSVDS
jgi:hypothetical protein